MKSMKNDVSVCGYVFDLGQKGRKLQKRVSGPNSKNPGQEFINGQINVATDDEGMNVVTVDFQFVYPTKKDGSPNNVFKVLEDLIEDCDTFEECGTDATQVRILGSVAVNDFVNNQGEMVAARMIRGGFISTDVRRDPTFGATFDTDILIAGVTEREVEDGDDYAQIRGYVFNFFGEAIPVTLDAHNPAAINYFMSLDASNSNPVLTEVKGEITSATIERKIEEESAFGDPVVHTVTHSIRSWDIKWARPETYEWDDESTLTKAEFKEMIMAREERLAAERKRHEEYLASKEGQSGFPAAKPAKKKAAAKPKKEAAPVVEEEEDDDDFPF